MGAISRYLHILLSYIAGLLFYGVSTYNTFWSTLLSVSPSMTLQPAATYSFLIVVFLVSMVIMYSRSKADHESLCYLLHWYKPYSVCLEVYNTDSYYVQIDLAKTFIYLPYVWTTPTGWKKVATILLCLWQMGTMFRLLSLSHTKMRAKRC